MIISFNKPLEDSITSIMRRIQYSPQGEDQKTGELKFSRFLGPSGYPRFHIYLKNNNGKLIINLHLDQKKPSYNGTSAHSGEYDGEIVEKEAERIKKALQI